MQSYEVVWMHTSLVHTVHVKYSDQGPSCVRDTMIMAESISAFVLRTRCHKRHVRSSPVPSWWLISLQVW